VEYRAFQLVPVKLSGPWPVQVRDVGRQVQKIYGTPQQILTGIQDEETRLALSETFPDVPVVLDDRRAMRQNYWFGYEESA
jgi:hypothetical protein